jgi:hypothetical protein
MNQTIEEKNTELVLKAFDTLFNVHCCVDQNGARSASALFLPLGCGEWQDHTAERSAE